MYRRRSYVIGIGNFVFRHCASRKQCRCKGIYVGRGAIQLLPVLKCRKAQLRLLVVTASGFRKDMLGNEYIAIRRGFRPPLARPCLLDGMIRIGGWP